MAIYILIFDGAEVLKTLQNIHLVLSVHRINLLHTKGISKFSILREAGTLFL